MISLFPLMIRSPPVFLSVRLYFDSRRIKRKTSRAFSLRMDSGVIPGNRSEIVTSTSKNNS